MRTPILAACAGAALLMCVGCDEPVTQPLQFPHKKHTEELECVDCHKYNRTQTFSGLPTVEDCMDCHEEPQTDSPEEEKIRAAASEGVQLEWNRLYKVPDHVYYSHRRHVVLGKIPCESCHCDIGQTMAPPTKPAVAITMDFCIDCHKEQQVPVDCVTCHR